MVRSPQVTAGTGNGPVYDIIFKGNTNEFQIFTKDILNSCHSLAIFVRSSCGNADWGREKIYKSDQTYHSNITSTISFTFHRFKAFSILPIEDSLILLVYV